MCFRRVFFFSPMHVRSMREFFSDYHCENLVEFLEVKLTKVWEPQWLAGPGVLISPTCPCWASSNLSVIVPVFLHQPWLWGRFVLVGFCPARLNFLHLPVGLQFWGALFCDLTSLMDLRKTVGFSPATFSAFYLLGRSINFQLLMCWTRNLKFCVSSFFFFLTVSNKAAINILEVCVKWGRPL